jgi:uncharacterized protein (TIGR02145 family)
VTGLTNGTAYTFRVVATNAIGNSVASAASTAVTPVAPNTVPDPPTAVVATAGNASASVAFVAPTNNGGSAITGYSVTSSPGGITATGATSPINMTGLTNGTAYTFTVVATNAIGNSVPSAASTAVTPVVPSAPCSSTITDIDGNLYDIVTIGNQCWTKQNLRVTKYTDGTLIPLDVTGDNRGESTIWQNLYKGAYTIYGKQTSSGQNAIDYGFLYNWYAVKGVVTPGSTTYKNLCPTGYHVPTDNEWGVLLSYLNPDSGGKLKSTTLWDSPNTGANNSSGFSALPGGFRDIDGAFLQKGIRASFWTSTDSQLPFFGHGQARAGAM